MGVPKLRLEKAIPEDSSDLMATAVRSESYWKFDDEMIERYCVSHPFDQIYMNQHLVYWMVDKEGNRMGFFSLMNQRDMTELESFYLEPQYIGRGYGRSMWLLLLGVCRQEAIDGFQFEANPEARLFYEKQGAVVIGEVESKVQKDRMLPLFHMKL